MASHLASGRINLAVLRESYRRELLECLDRCTGSKVALMGLACISTCKGIVVGSVYSSGNAWAIIECVIILDSKNCDDVGIDHCFTPEQSTSDVETVPPFDYFWHPDKIASEQGVLLPHCH